MDISTLGVVDAANKPGKMPLLNPFNGEETGATFHVLGYDSEPVIEAGREFDRAQASRGQSGGASEIMRRRRIALALAAVTGWDDFVFGGEKVKFTKAKAQEIMEQPNFGWIVDQVQRFGGDRANFSPAAQSA